MDQEKSLPGVIEIGELGMFYRCMPEQTEAYYAGYRADQRQGRPWFGARAFWRFVRQLRKDQDRLLVLNPPFYPGWHPRSFLAAFKFTLFRGKPRDLYGALVSPLLFQLLRFVPVRRCIAVERWYSFGMPRHHFFLLDKAEIFYKRELPIDRWWIFYGSAHRRLPGKNFRLKPKWRARIARLRPISLGLSPEQAASSSAAFGEAKRADIFYSGAIEGNSTPRLEVPVLLEKFRQAGFVVDAPDRRLPLDEFNRRCAQAWITLSPAGLSWECYRHMEAALAGSVPLVSAPTIERYRPLSNGEHCLVYYPDENDCIEVVKTALADKERLRRMGEAARQHVLDHLTEEAMCRQLLRDHAIAAR